MTKTSTTTATVETLAAEVRVLQVGSRQITASVAKQLDRMEWPEGAAPIEFEPFGRVRSGVKVDKTRALSRKPSRVTERHWYGKRGWMEDYEGAPYYEFIGRRVADGALVLMVAEPPSNPVADDEREEWKTLTDWNDKLPLIVLAGLR